MHRLPPPALRALEAHPIQCFHVCPSATGYLKLFLKKICQAPVLYPPTTGNKASSPDLRTFSLSLGLECSLPLGDGSENIA